MYKQNREIYELKAGQTGNINSLSGEALTDKLHKRYIMIIGEGTVFFLIMILGVARVRHSFKKEADLAQQQKNFILSITHELKSPLASVKLQLETLLKRDLSADNKNKVIGNALADAERLDYLVENILMAANLESSGYRLYLERLNFSDFVIDFLEKFKSRNNKSEILSNIQDNVFISADKTAILSVIQNLMENAVKYSGEGSSVSVNLYKKNNDIILEVGDQGIGINEEEKKKVFRKFYRIGNEETRGTKGTGLGLYIVKHLVELHKGNVTIKDNKPRGAIFEITLPSNEK